VIDALNEEVISPKEATRYYPRDNLGRKVHVSTVYRHATVGVRGILLESIRTPRMCTSKEAIARFFQRLSERTNTDAPARPVVNQQRHEKQIEAELDRLGL